MVTNEELRKRVFEACGQDYEKEMARIEFISKYIGEYTEGSHKTSK